MVVRVGILLTQMMGYKFLLLQEDVLDLWSPCSHVVIKQAYWA